MRYLRLLLAVVVITTYTSCTEESTTDNETITNNDNDNNGGDVSGSTDWSVNYWKRDDAGTYLDLVGNTPVFCSNNEIVGGTYSTIDWVSNDVGYFTLTTVDGDFEFEIKRNGSGLILSPFDPQIQQTHNPSSYSVVSSFPCDDNDNGNTNELQDLKFWTNQDYGCGNVTVNLQGVGSSTISGFFNSAPSCNTPSVGGNFNNLEAGTYSYSASCTHYSWSGTVTLQNGCTTLQLTL